MLMKITVEGCVERVLDKDQLDGTGEVYWVGTDKPHHEFIDLTQAEAMDHEGLAARLRSEYTRLPNDYEGALLVIQTILLFTDKPHRIKARKELVTRLVMEGFIHMAFLRGGVKVLQAARGGGNEVPDGHTKSWVPNVLRGLLGEWADSQRYQGWNNGGRGFWGRCQAPQCLSHGPNGDSNSHEALFWTKIDPVQGTWRCHFCGAVYLIPPAGQRLPTGWERIPDPHEPGITHCIPGRDY